jgi:hypothetical protein
MTYKFFIPSDCLIKTAQSTLRLLAVIASAMAVVAMAGAGLYILIWFCNVLTLFIHAFADVCQATFTAINGNYAGVFATFIIWMMLLISVKATCVLIPSIMSSFRMQGVRV